MQWNARGTGGTFIFIEGIAKRGVPEESQGKEFHPLIRESFLSEASGTKLDNTMIT